GSSVQFDAGDVAAFGLGGISSLTAGSFNYLSVPAGGSGPFPTAAHVQGIGEDSGWVTAGSEPVPDPATLTLLAVGACPCLLSADRRVSLQRRRRRQQGA
ncbi:MAG TPA: hypothetical protein VFJ30_15040, partial [Phycisphaerae bacterium]|nr:hypothetical protein [Phycisphaerae bacterium]